MGKLTREQKDRIVKMFDRNYSSRYLAGLFGVTQPTITYTIRRARKLAEQEVAHRGAA